MAVVAEWSLQQGAGDWARGTVVPGACGRPGGASSVDGIVEFKGQWEDGYEKRERERTD